jgi:hypothetical protein
MQSQTRLTPLQKAFGRLFRLRLWSVAVAIFWLCFPLPRPPRSDARFQEPRAQLICRKRKFHFEKFRASEKPGYILIEPEDGGSCSCFVEARNLEDSGTTGEAMAHDMYIGVLPANKLTVHINKAVFKYNFLLDFY